MPAPGTRLDSSVRQLLDMLREPPLASGATERDWDGIVRVARASRLLAPLGARLAEAGVLDRMPPPVRSHIESEQVLAAHCAQMARRVLGDLERTLGGRGFPLVLLKGAAYLTQGLAVARGRQFSDVDLLVPRAHLDEAERLLREAGWAFGELDAHDERYYREWSHELPPLQHPQHPLQLDLHHSILPPTGRVRPDDAALFAAAVPADGTGFRVLSPADQVLHACAHVFQDSDLSGMFRDLVDLDGLLREFGARPGFWEVLARRAGLHGLGRVLWYGLDFCAGLLATPVPERVWESLSFAKPGPLVRWTMSGIGQRALLPGNPDRLPSLAKRSAQRVLFLRYLWLRFPLRLLAVHGAAKAARRFRPRRIGAPEP
jgi:hypothetical protein